MRIRLDLSELIKFVQVNIYAQSNTNQSFINHIFEKVEAFDIPNDIFTSYYLSIRAKRRHFKLSTY